jgi:TatD DNase family protein
MFIDTHCHLDAPSCSARLPELLDRARRAGVGQFIVPGVGPDGWHGIALLAAREDGVFPAYGLHPMLAGLYREELLAELARYAETAVAIGEIGLDYLLEGVSREKQVTAFRAQLRLAVAAGRPVLIHCRHAFRDLLQILREEQVARVGGVMHAFSGSPDVARECIGLGLAISVAGPVTYRNAVRPVEVVRSVPLDHLLLETDAPDLTPEPFRGEPNEPAYLRETAKKVAQVKGVSLAEVEQVTTRNAERLFRLEHAAVNHA